jgi:hypothetical protein
MKIHKTSNLGDMLEKFTQEQSKMKTVKTAKYKESQQPLQNQQPVQQPVQQGALGHPVIAQLISHLGGLYETLNNNINEMSPLQAVISLGRISQFLTNSLSGLSEMVQKDEELKKRRQALESPTPQQPVQQPPQQAGPV